jgi:hypothetical protein
MLFLYMHLSKTLRFLFFAVWLKPYYTVLVHISVSLFHWFEFQDVTYLNHLSLHETIICSIHSETHMLLVILEWRPFFLALVYRCTWPNSLHSLVHQNLTYVSCLWSYGLACYPNKHSGFSTLEISKNF